MSLCQLIHQMMESITQFKIIIHKQTKEGEKGSPTHISVNYILLKHYVPLQLILKLCYLYYYIFSTFNTELVSYSLLAINTYLIILIISEDKKNNGVLEKVLIGIGTFVVGLVFGKVASDCKKKKQINVRQIEYTDIENYDEIEELMTCPITYCIMKDPVIIPECGHSCEKKDITQYLSRQGKCPVCRTSTKISSLKPNYNLKKVIDRYEEQRRTKQ